MRQTAGNGVSNQRVRERQIAASSQNLTFLDPDLDTGLAKPRMKFVINEEYAWRTFEKRVDPLVIRFQAFGYEDRLQL